LGKEAVSYLLCQSKKWALKMRNSKPILLVEDDDVDVMTVERVLKHLGRDRNTASATLGKGLSVSAFPLYVPV